MPDLEIDATPVDTRVLLSYVVHPEFGRFLVRHEVSSIREHRVVRPSFGDAEISIPGIDAEGKIINIAGAQIANQHVIISIRSVNLYKYYVEGGYVEKEVFFLHRNRITKQQFIRSNLHFSVSLRMKYSCEIYFIK